MKFISNVKKFISKNSTNILTCISVCGLVSTSIFVCKGTVKAVRVVDELNLKDPKDILKETYKFYIPAATMGFITSVCIVSSNSINHKRNAALASLYSISENSLKRYQNKVIDEIGKNKEQKIRDEVAKEIIENTNEKTIECSKGNVLCFDVVSGRYFESNLESLRRIENKLNHDLISDMWISLNDLYYELNLKGVKYGDYMGWDVDKMIEFDFSTQLTEEGVPCVIIDYDVYPKYDF